MKTVIAASCLVALTACGAVDPNQRSAVANFQGDNLEVIWSTGSSGKATIIVDERGVDSLPVAALDSRALTQFFEQVTKCRVIQGEPMSIIKAGGAPFSIVVPYAC